MEVFVHTGPAEWWQIAAALGPLAVLLGAVVAGYIGWRTLRQKSKADDRAEWWKRTQWALDAVYSGDKKRGTVGLKVLRVLAESDLAGGGELAVLEAAWEKPLSDAEHSLAMHAATTGKTQGRRVAARPSAAGTGRTRIYVSGGEALARRRAEQALPRDRPPGVDGEPGPGDNGEEGTSGAAKGGQR